MVYRASKSPPGQAGEKINMKLSKRLELVVFFATRVSGPLRIADVGTDHGYVPIAAARRDPGARCIAMDVRPGPLERAR